MTDCQEQPSSFGITNIIASITCAQPIPLKLVQHIPGVRYNFSKFKCDKN